MASVYDDLLKLQRTRGQELTVRILKVGDQVVFAMSKRSVSPGPRARQVTAGTKGDQYSYVVDKYWMVNAVHDDETVTLVTRRGKEHRVPLNHPCLRPANLWERFVRAGRFPSPPFSDEHPKD